MDTSGDSHDRAWVDALRRAYAESLDAGNSRWIEAAAEIASGTLAAEVLARRAALALSLMTADDPTSLGMSACDVLLRYGGAAERPGLVALRPTLPAKPGLRDWRVDLDRALASIDARIRGACTCTAEAGCGAPIRDDLWTVDGERNDVEQSSAEIDVHCQRCGSAWTVRRYDGYHFPLFSWTGR